MRRGQDSPANKSLKRPGREPWNGRKDIKVVLIITAFTPGLAPGVLYRLLIDLSCRNSETFHYSRCSSSIEEYEVKGE